MFVVEGYRKGMIITVHNDVSQLTNYTESQCAYYAGEIKWAWHLIPCYRPKSGRYLRAQLLYANTNSRTKFNLYEFMVYGY